MLHCVNTSMPHRVRSSFALRPHRGVQSVRNSLQVAGEEFGVDVPALAPALIAPRVTAEGPANRYPPPGLRH